MSFDKHILRQITDVSIIRSIIDKAVIRFVPDFIVVRFTLPLADITPQTMDHPLYSNMIMTDGLNAMSY